MTKSGDIGTKTETAVVKFLKLNGWGNAERRRLKGSGDWGDIISTPALVWEVKGGHAAWDAIGQDATMADWRAETEAERRNAGADIGILVMQRKGFPLSKAGRWFCSIPWLTLANLHAGVVMSGYPDSVPHVLIELGDLCAILRLAGYGDPR